MKDIYLSIALLSLPTLIIGQDFFTKRDIVPTCVGIIINS